MPKLINLPLPSSLPPAKHGFTDSILFACSNGIKRLKLIYGPTPKTWFTTVHLLNIYYLGSNSTGSNSTGIGLGIFKGLQRLAGAYAVSPHQKNSLLHPIRAEWKIQVSHTCKSGRQHGLLKRQWQRGKQVALKIL